jgi:hypothetical protein
MHDRPPKSALRAAWAACAALICAPFAAFADWTLGSSAVLRHDDNVGNAHDAYGMVGDFSATAKLSLFDVLQMGEDYSLALGGNVRGEFYDKLIGLRNGSVEGVVSLKKKFGLGAFAPWIRASISPGRANFDDGYRDATIYRATADFGKRLDDRWNLWGAYAFDRRIARPGLMAYSTLSTDVFTQHSRSVLANLEYSVSPRATLTAGALLRHGDVISTQSPEIYTYVNARAAVADPTFGPNQVAYRFFGTTYGLRLGLNFAVNAHNLLGLGMLRTETHAPGGNDYTNSTPELIWNYRY